LGPHRIGEPRHSELEVPSALHRQASEAGDPPLKGGDVVIVKQLEKMFAEARKNRTWGEITIMLKDGKAVLIKQTIQEKVEDNPQYGHST